MPFRFDRFWRINRRVFIWLVIIGLLYLLRDFFALIFLTFLLVSSTLPVIRYFQRETRFHRTVITVVLYLVISASLIGLSMYVADRVTVEALSAASELSDVETRILLLKDQLKWKYPQFAPRLDQVFTQSQINDYLAMFRKKAQAELKTSAMFMLKAVSTILLSLLFSFLIVLDLSRLTIELRKFEHSKLHAFYTESAQPVVRFASVIARAFRAQAMIAVVNTILTMLGLWLLGLKKIVLLGIIVFFCSFIPVLGVFISTTPAVLVGLNASGYGKALAVIALVIIIHIIEAYILNPLIYGQQLKLNPVLVLIILFVGHHFFGIWGMLLGVPVAYYFLHYVFAVPFGDEAGVTPDEGAEKVKLQEPVEQVTQTPSA